MADPSFGRLPATSAPIETFIFDVPDQEIVDFKKLLELSKLAPETWYNHQEDGSFGVSRQWLKHAKEAWLESDWRKQEAHLNSVPNFSVTLETECGPTTLHFAALFSSRRDALPVIFMHSWPGGFFEYLPMMHLLAREYTPETLPYNVIVPSIPGFGTSTTSLATELTYDHVAEILHQLMILLGFESGYVAQGGDVGSSLARIMAARFNACKAIHITMLIAENEQQISKDEPLSPHEQVVMQRMSNFMSNGISYALFNGLRPSTAGLVMSSNPLALLAYIGEKLIEWADPRSPLSLDSILSTASFYWHTRCFARSLFQYPNLAKSFVKGSSMELPMLEDKPMGYASFAGDIVGMPHSWAKKVYPTLKYTMHEKGGHFPALEQPVIFLQAIQTFLSNLDPRLFKTS